MKLRLPLLLLAALLAACSDEARVQPVSPVVTGISVEPATATRAVGQDQQFGAIASYSDGSSGPLTQGVSWTSSVPAVATIGSASGLATALSAGETVITANYGSFLDTATLAVTPPVLERVLVTPTPVTKVVGQTQQFAATAVFSDDSQQPLSSGVAWSSSVPAIAGVNATGLATALAAGETEIRATYETVTGAAQLTVTAVPVPALPFQAGAGEASASFLPLPGSVCLGGYDLSCGRNATTEHDPLLAEAVAITGADSGSFLLVKTTNVGYFAAYKAGNGPNGLYDIRQRIARELHLLLAPTGAPPITADRIVVTADHSHQGPDTIGIWGGVSPVYMAILAQAAVDAGIEAFLDRRPARLYAGAVQGQQTDGSYELPPTDDPDREFRVLYAEAASGARIATLMNYAPHATVLSSDNEGATGDWTAWAAQVARLQSGGTGIGLVGALGAMDWGKSGDNPQREAEARLRIATLLGQAFATREELEGNDVQVRTIFVREPLTAPILLANYLPTVDLPELDSVAIERADSPPWTGGGVIGTYASAARIGDAFIAAIPGEPFPQIHYALRNCDTLPENIEADTECGGVGARWNFLLGGAQDFLGYMVLTPEQYQQTLEEGLFYLAPAGPEDIPVLGEQLGLGGTCDLPDQIKEPILGASDGACPDHWTLMVSPTIGRHMFCTLQAAAAELGFGVGEAPQECALLTAFDGIAAPSEYPEEGPVSVSPADLLANPAGGPAASCRAQGGPEELCAGLEQVGAAVGAQITEALGSNPLPPVPSAPSKAGVAVKDASWHLGASAGQFADSGAGIARDAGFDPYGHSVRKVGADILGNRITVRALVIEDGDGNRVAIATNELYLPNDLLHRRVAQLLREHDLVASLTGGTVTGITDANLATTSSHSHTSPFYSTPGWGTWIFQDVFDLRFYEYMATQMADAIIEAAGAMKTVRMGGAVAPFNGIQSHTYGPKVDAANGTPAGQPFDYTTQQVSVVRFDEIDGTGAFVRPLANWVVFGVHPEWVWGEEIVNGDVTHATMRMLDRELGAVTLMSQSETGASGPHKDERVHLGAARREFQESALAGADRGGRLLADTVKTAWTQIASGNTTGLRQFAPMRDRFRVASASQRFAPPLTRPYPGVSNCNTDRTFEGDVGLPILGFPDCFYNHTEVTGMVTEPFFAALPYSPTALRDELVAAGVPIPTSYSATTLTAVEETAALHLMVFKLGDIVATLSPTEQFTSGALNLIGRLDRVPGNHWHGWDWICQLPASHAARRDESAGVAQFCARQTALFPDSRGMQGDVSNADDIERIRAQIHNDATGWEIDPVYAIGNQRTDGLEGLGGEAESADPASIKGNFTHEEFTSHGYAMVVPVGMVNDYWGYMPEYREYRSHDHYRKALNGLGPHGADFVNTRIARMAANLNFANATLPFNPLDASFQAEGQRAEALAQALGEAARAYTAGYEAQLPADGGVAEITQQPEPIVERFSAATIKFRAGSNYEGAPDVRVERCLDAPACTRWETYGTQDGEVQVQLAFLPALVSETVEIPVVGEGAGAAVPDPTALALWRAGMFEWIWTASFEAFVSELDDLGDRPAVTPEGVYRFVVEGRMRGMGGMVADYEPLVSGSFTVVPWNGITVSGIAVEGDGRVAFSIGPQNTFTQFKSGAGDGDITASPGYVVAGVDYPDSYADGITWIRNERQLYQYQAGRGDDQQYCGRCTFRPWADRADVASATVTVTAGASTQAVAATRRASDGKWVTVNPIPAGASARVAIGGIVDEYGEKNGTASASVTR